MTWNGIERRAPQVCPLHANLETALGEISKELRSNSKAVVGLQGVIEDGLKSTVADMKCKVDEVHSKVENFTWFSEWVTQVRDNLFKNAIKVACFGAIIWFIFNFGKQGITRLIGG